MAYCEESEARKQCDENGKFSITITIGNRDRKVCNKGILKFVTKIILATAKRSGYVLVC